MNSFFSGTKVQLFFLGLVVFLSRLPFLTAGFGVEEDSWLLAITAKNIALSGNYELSRAPGHPLQEIIYSWMWNAAPFYFNLLSAIASVVAVLFFALALKQLNFKHYLFAAFAFAFAPVVFSSSTYTIDYMLAMAFVMGSFYFITSSLSPLSLRRGIGGEVFAGIMLGIAIGFRLTSVAMLFPFCIFLFPVSKDNFKKIFILIFSTLVTGLLAYFPVIKTYGFSFFTYADQFPYPNFPKVIYKATFGVFGTIGIASIIFFKLKLLKKVFSKREKLIPIGIPNRIFLTCSTVIIIYIISYLNLPQKSAYLIPIVPFVILLFGYYLSSLEFKIFCLLLTLSAFLFSMNLTDSIRGAKYSPMAVKFITAEQEIFIDPLTGPVFSDYTKRLNKIAYTEEVFQKTRVEQKKIILICGWWYNELLVRNWNSEPNQNLRIVFYIDTLTMEKYIAEGYEIYYLPEQNIYNDQYSKMNCTDSLSKPYL